MMDEFGEWHRIYVWPAGHEEGEPFPEDFYERITQGLHSVGIEWESV